MTSKTLAQNLFQDAYQEHLSALEQSFTPSQIEILEKITSELVKCFKAEKKVMLCGNGGSAADSQHIAAEFVGRFHRERKSLPSIALTTDTSILTAIGNDYSYEDIFARQVEGLGVSGDVLIAISTSGNSPNVLKAAQRAKEKGIHTIGLTGQSGGKLAGMADILFKVPSKKTPHIQEIHITVLHAVSEAVEKALFGPGA